MLVSYSRDFLFIHIPKNAGASVNQALRPWADSPELHWTNRALAAVGIHVNHLGPYRWKRFRRHTRAATVRRNLPPRVWEGLFKFAFVRNPWDRLVSQYKYILQMPSHHRHRLVQKMTFAEFVDFWTRGENGLQTPFVTGRGGEILVDFIGRCETLPQDFRHVCRELGIEAEIPHVNRSQHKDYRSYFSPAVRDLAAMRLRQDIDLFGYAFDSPALADEPQRRSA